MIIPLKKLMTFQENRYLLSRAAMVTVDKRGNIDEYPQDKGDIKLVSNIMDLLLNEKVHYKMKDCGE
ncbi:MAG: hypothetical protein SVR08_09090 [Spirochaetota bacterium]|nr:hypothetical protein [Spirochaetota bacterium]